MLRLAVTSLLAAGLIAAGCGGDGDGGGGGDGAPTKAEYIVRADAVCARFDRRSQPLRARLQAMNDNVPALQRDGPAVMRSIVSLGRQALGELRALPLPREDAAGATEFYGVVDAGLTSFGELAEALHARDMARVSALLRTGRREAERQRALARAYGFRDCGSG